jgi:transglutaminase-like putative cysteine protease
VSDRAPDALVPVWAARLVGFAALAALGALQWQRMVDGLSSGRALLWVAAAVAAGAAVLACDRLPWRQRGIGTLLVAVLALIAALAVSGIELWYLKPAHWHELIDGLISGSQSLGTVRLPYAGPDPWPRLTLQVAGSVLLTAAALLACWPRVGGRASRGYLFLSLMALLVAVVSPVVSLGGARPLLLGAGIAALTVCFLWLERLPLRPGLGVALLLGVALAGALPLAAVADRGEPWFDYKSFAEGLGPDDPVRFSWDQRYGPIDWPREGNEVMRVKSDEPHYWKAANLERFDGIGFADAGSVERDGDDPIGDLREDWRNQPGWLDEVEVSVRRMRTLDVIAPGTVMDVKDATRPVQPSGQPGRWTARSELRRGDSYTAEVYVPTPSGAEVRTADQTGFRLARPENLEMTVALRPGRRPTFREVGGVGHGRIDTAVLHFRPFGDTRAPYVTYPQVHRTGFGVADRTFRRSQYRRTWALAKRLRRQSETPFEYILAVNAYLRDGFRYSERPAPTAPGRAPLDAFLFDTKEGYCQHFAGAMAMLLRMGGVPARVATGFSPGGFSKRRDAWIVRDTDAHAWVETWFDELGWVTYDPTPDLTPARSQIAALEEPAPAPPSATDPSTALGGGGQAARRLNGVRPDLLLDPLRTSADGPGTADEGGLPWWTFLLAGLAVAALVLWIALRVRRRRASGPVSPLDRAVAELEEALRRAGRPVEPGTTLRQLEHRLGASEEATAYLRALSASRYGAAPRLPTVEERRALRRALAQGLGFAGRLRALWALPPRRGEHTVVEVDLRVRGR